MIFYAGQGFQHRILLVSVGAGFTFADGSSAVAAGNTFFRQERALRGAGAPEFAVLNEYQSHGHQCEKQSKYYQAE